MIISLHLLIKRGVQALWNLEPVFFMRTSQILRREKRIKEKGASEILHGDSDSRVCAAADALGEDEPDLF